MFVPSITKILCLLFVAYMSSVTYSMYKLFSPPPCSRSNCIDYYLKSSPKLQLIFFTTTRSNLIPSQTLFVGKITNLDYLNSFQTPFNLTIPKTTQRNGTLFLHAFLLLDSYKITDVKDFHSGIDFVHTKVKLTDFRVPATSTYQLLFGDKNYTSGSTFSHLKSEVTLRILTELDALPKDNIPSEIFEFVRLSLHNTLLPVMVSDSLNDHLGNYKNTTNRPYAEIKINYSPINIGKLRLMLLIDNQFLALKKYGISQKDIDEVKSVLADTNVYLLCVTLVVASVHLLLDTLAFKNDVIFWRNRTSLVGVSLRAVIWRAGSQVVIFLYLLDEEASFLILIPAGIAVIIEFWKLQKVTPFDCFKFRFKKQNLTEEELNTRIFDEQGMRYLSYLLYPLCIIAPIYCLLYLEYKSWYSWLIHSLVNCVYAFGFLLMLPQLFINYKLKSVAHLPWKAFMYKAFNTFIDDLFAFIIHMPTAHRLACFRDDVVFLIYLYQRWLYPVDSNRLDGDVSEKAIKKD